MAKNTIMVDVGVIGVPAGFYSKTEDVNVPYQRYLDTFYRDEVRHAPKAMYIYKHSSGWVVYTFTVGSGNGTFASHAGRSGSFFGIALGVKDAEFTNPEHVYNLLNHVYETSVRGKIISDDGKNKKWLYGPYEFADAWKTVETSVLGNINKFVFNEAVDFKYNPNKQCSFKFTPSHQGDTPPAGAPKTVTVNSEKSAPAQSKNKQFEVAIAKLNQMGIDPNALAKYISEKGQNR